MSGNALLEDEAACGFSLDLILSTYGMCTVYLHTDSSSEDDEGNDNSNRWNMHVWRNAYMEYM